MKWRWAFLVILTLSLGAVLVWQHRSLVALNDTIEAARRSLAQKKIDRGNEKAASERSLLAADQVALHADRAVVLSLRRELDAIRQRAVHPAQTRVTQGSQELAIVPPSLADVPISYLDWRNVGADSPEAAIETTLWAAAGGDTEVMASLFDLDASVRQRSEELLKSLPDDFQSQFSTVEQFVAFMTVRDVPLGSAQIMRKSHRADGEMLAIKLINQDGDAKMLHLTTRQVGNAWKLVVPESAIDHYFAFVQGQMPSGSQGLAPKL